MYRSTKSIIRICMYANNVDVDKTYLEDGIYLQNHEISFLSVSQRCFPKYFPSELKTRLFPPHGLPIQQTVATIKITVAWDVQIFYCLTMLLLSVLQSVSSKMIGE
jgi:hypothetical protein